MPLGTVIERVAPAGTLIWREVGPLNDRLMLRSQWLRISIAGLVRLGSYWETNGPLCCGCDGCDGGGT